MLSNVKKELKALLLKGDLLVMSLSVYLGFVLQNFLQSLVKNIFYPFISSLIPKNLVKSIKINNHTIDIKDIIENFINLFIGIVMSYIIIRILLRYLD